MTLTPPKSFERIGFAAMAALTLAPVFFHAGWLWIALALGAEGDAYSLTLAAWVVASGAVIAYWVFNQQILLRSILVASLVSIGMAVILGKDFQSMLVIALALMALAIFVSSLIVWLVAHLPLDLDGLAKQHKIKAALFIVLAVFTIGQTARISTFMGDAERVELSMMPDLPFFITHSCLTAYVHALKLAQAGEKNLYDVAHWPDETAQYAGSAKEIVPYAPFYLDTFMYPPQFLLLAGAILSVSHNFLVQRAIWFGFSGFSLALGFWAVASWVGEKGKRDALWLIPLLWSSLLVMITLQIGNVHHLMMVLAVLAMVAFERKQPVLGGALLAFAIVSKISPAFLGVILLVQRRWHEAAWTFAFGIIFTALAVIVFGIQPMQSFLLYAMPRISSGEAMGWLDNSVINILINSGPFGIPFKLSVLGMPFDNVWGTARIINSLYTLAILSLTVWVALQKRDRYQKLYLWLGVLTLSALQSPFAPGYAIMPVLWILTLLATEIKNVGGLIVIALIWLLFSSQPLGTETMALISSLFQQIVVFAVVIFAFWRKPAQLTPVPQLA